MNDRPTVVDVLLVQREAWQRGEQLPVEELLARHPHLADDNEAVLDLIYNETVLREQTGHHIDPIDYFRRFPHLADALRTQFEVEAALARNDLLDHDGSTVEHPLPTVSAPASLPRLEGCEILGELGRGAMGVVYRGWQRANQRPVAIKLLAADVPAPRVSIEAAAASRLQHPHIVQVFEVKEFNGRTALVLEYVEGGNLAQKLAGKPQPPRDSARLVETLAWAMAYAHGRGVIHRDLKPSNVLLSAGPDAPLRDCVPKIGDFGLAKLLEASSHVTATQDILGTPSYMAPEQTGGASSPIGVATDVYALGAILYECLTGRPPFLGESVLDTLEQVRHQEPVPPSHLQPRLPLDLEIITLKCLHKAPERRYHSARDLAEDLRRFLAGEPIRARSVGLLERAWKWALLQPARALLLLVSALAALGLLVAGFVVNHLLLQQRDLARQHAAQLDEQLQRTRRLLYTAQLLRVGSVWENDPAQGLRMLEDRRACPPDLRCLSWRILHGQCRRYRLNLPTGSSGVSALSRYPRGQLLASGDPLGQVRLWDLTTQAETSRLTTSGKPITALVFSPDGLLLAAGSSDGRVSLWEMPAAIERGNWTVEGRVNSLAWHRDGRTLAVAAGERVAQVTLWDARALRLRRSLRGDTHPLAAVALSPDGQTAVSAAPDHALRIWDTRTGKPGRLLRGHLAPVTGVGFSPDGSRILSAALDGALRVWDLTRETELFRLQTAPVVSMAVHPSDPVVILGTRPSEGRESTPDLRLIDWQSGREGEPQRGHHGELLAVAFAADGSHFLSAGADQSIKVWDYPGRRTQLRVAGQVGTPGSATLSQNGQILAWMSRGDQATGPPAEIVVADAESANPIQTFRAQGRTFQALALSADGRYLVASAGHPNEPAEVLLWEVRSGRLVQALRGHPVEVPVVHFSPDGRSLASLDLAGTIRLWNVESGSLWRSLDPTPVTPLTLAWVREQLLIAGNTSQGNGSLLVYRPTSGELIQRLDLAVEGRTLTVEPSGRLAAVAGLGDQVELLDLERGISRDRFSIGIKQIASLAFADDGSTLVLAGSPGGIKLWDIPTAQERASLPGHRGGTCFVGIAPASRFLVSFHPAQTVRWWYSAPAR